MARVTPNKLLNKRGKIGKALRELLEGIDPPLFVISNDDKVLFGEPIEGIKEVHPVSFQEKPVAWVSGQIISREVADLLSVLLELENEKKDLATEVLERYRELNLLYNFSGILTASPDPEAIAQVTLDQASRLIRATAGAIVIRRGEIKDEDLKESLNTIAYCGSPLCLNKDLLEPSGFIFEVLVSGKAGMQDDANGGDYLNVGEGEVSTLCAPLKTEQGVIGAVLLVNSTANAYTAGDLKLLNTIALQAAPAMEIARLHQMALENARMERELQMARDVQVGLMPLETPEIPGWEFATHWSPARQVSGDYFDFIFEGPDQLGLLIADVSDKGMPASLFMVFSRSAVRASLDKTLSPAESIQRANQIISSESTNGYFVTLFYSRLNPVTGEMIYVNAGHNPGLLYQYRGDQITALNRTGMSLGVFEDEIYQESSFDLQPDDFVLLYTDGVTEAADVNGEEFGIERLENILHENYRNSAQEIISAVVEAVGEFCGEAPVFDDLTLMLVKRC